jgi:hypothetical protein
MKKGQEFTPKYWIAHNTTTSDVYLATASKRKSDVDDRAADYFGSDWVEDGIIAVDLFELRIVDND